MNLPASCDGGRIGATWIGEGEGEDFPVSRRRTRRGSIQGTGVGNGGNVVRSGGDLREIDMLAVAAGMRAIGGSV